MRTGAGAGWHLYVAPTGLPDHVGVLEGVDYRAAGRYVVAPPSRHPTTSRRYQWVPGRDLNTTLGEVPTALRERLTPGPAERQPAPAPMRPAGPGHPYGRAVLATETARITGARGPGQGRGGERNQVLWEAARNLYNLVAGVLYEAQVAGELERAAAACGLLRDEPRQTIRTLASARQVGMAHPRGIPERPTSSSHRQDHQRLDACTISRFVRATASRLRSAEASGALKGGDAQQRIRPRGGGASIPPGTAPPNLNMAGCKGRPTAPLTAHPGCLLESGSSPRRAGRRGTAAAMNLPGQPRSRHRAVARRGRGLPSP